MIRIQFSKNAREVTVHAVCPICSKDPGMDPAQCQDQITTVPQSTGHVREISTPTTLRCPQCKKEFRVRVEGT